MRIITMIANKGVLKIFSALLIVVIVMSVSNYIVFKNSISEIYEQVSDNNRIVAENIIKSIDESFRDINNLIYSINMLPYDSLNSVTDEFNEYLMQKDISILMSSVSMDYIEDVITFYKGSDLAFTSFGTVNLHEFLEQNYGHQIYNSEYWKAYASKKHALKVFQEDYYIEMTSTYGENRKKIFGVVGNNNLSKKNIIVFINVDDFLKHVQQKEMMEGNSLIVLDQNKKVILSTDENWDLSEMTQEKRDYEYNVYHSDYNDYTYINKAPYRFTNIESVTQANYLIMRIFIVCAVLLSAMLSIYLYKPMKHIHKLFGGAYKQGNDFREIHRGIAKMQAENESYKLEIDGMNLEIRRGIFLDALDEFYHSQNFEKKMQKYFSDFLRGRYFVMAAFRLKSESDNGGSSPSVQIEEITEMIQNGLQKRMENVVVFYTGHLQFLALIGMHKTSDRNVAIKNIDAFVKKEKNEGFDSYSLLVAVSGTHPIKEINYHLAYKDLKDCIIYRNINADNPVIYKESVRFTWKVYFPLEEIDKLSNCLVRGNDGEGIRIVNQIIDANAKLNIHHHQLVSIAKCLFYLMVKHLKANDMEQRNIMAMEMIFCRQVESSFEYQEIVRELVKIVKYISTKTKNDHKSKMNPDFIAQYIGLHYMENLNLEHMAEILDTSPKYFSNYFKKMFGINYVEYLNKVRITNAKEILKKTDLTISEICEETGFMIPTTFSSTFKRYCGISPSEYRKNL